MNRNKSILAVGAVALMSSATFTGHAFAADMPLPPQPYYAPPPPQEDFGGWYLRGDIGMTNQRVKTLENAVTAQTAGLGFDSATLFGVGVGYQFNSWFRGDVIGQYRGKANIHGANYFSAPGGFDFANNYSGSKSEYLVMANAYVDLGTWWCVTPFIGAGVGASYNKISGFRDDGISSGGGGFTSSSTYFEDNGKWNLAWAAHAGVAYKVNQNVTLELAYSYVDLGSAQPGNFRAYDNSSSGPTSIKFKDITSHDLKLGVRWNLDSPPAYAPPPPLIRKG